MESKSIRQRLVTYTIVIMTIAVAVLTLLTAGILQSISDALQQQAWQAYLERNAGAAANLDMRLHTFESSVQALGMLVAAQDGDILDTHRTLLRNPLIEAYGIAEIGILYFGEPHQLLTFQTGAAGLLTRVSSQRFDTLPNAWFVAAADAEGVWATDWTAEHQATLAFAVPFTSPQGRTDGILYAKMDTSAINNLLWEAVRGTRADAEYHLLLTAEQQLVSGYQPNENQRRTRSLLTPAAWSSLQAQFAESLDSATDGFPITTQIFGGSSTSFSVHNTLETTGWVLINAVTEAPALPIPSSSIAILLIVELGTIIVLVSFIYHFLSVRVTLPLAVLNRAAQEIGAGDMRYQIDYQDQGDEIGRLANALEDMKTNLSHSYQQLARWSRKLENRVTERTKALEIAEREAQEKAEELRALYDESLTVVSEHDLQPLLQKFTTRIQTLLNTNYCGIWMLNEQKNTVKHVSKDGFYVDNVQSADEGLVGKVLQSAKPFIVDDYPHWPERLARALSENIHRVICVPLIYSGKPFGAVEAARGKDEAPFSERDQRLLTLFANLVAPAMYNAQLYVQLAQAKAEAERANQVKTRFLASVTHELRTPLNLIINNMDFMRVGAFGDVNDEQISRLDQTIRSAEHLLYLINDLLDTSKIEAGEMRLFIQMNDIYPVIEDSLASAVALLDNLGKGARVALTAQFPDNLPQIPMDTRRVRQVLINLLGNAVKFTESGEVNLLVEVTDEEIRFSVCDSGMGIADDERDKLFEVFERTHRARQMGIEGTGLGLPISRFFVQAHGGTLTFTSTVGVGSIFTFTLPRKELKPAKITDTQIIPILIPHIN